MKRIKEKEIISKGFQERLMIAVTEVNGCEMCSYKHTEEALKSGMSDEEIQSMLSGNYENIRKEESAAIFFAQHYAESGGNPDKEAWQRILDIYGEEKADAVLSTIKVIMMGNAYFIAVGALKNRLKGKPVKKSNFLQEIIITLSIIILVPRILINKIFKR
jgi:AhpD family alkylhydroperoxidase